MLLENTAGIGGTAGADYFALRHHNFNVVALVDTAGSVVERYDYNPYGERLVLDPGYGADADGLSDLGNPVGHQGLFHDEESGLVYNRARMLSPTLGRFIQRDPLGYVDGMNVYEYLRSSPQNNTDHLGLYSDIECYRDCDIMQKNMRERGVNSGVARLSWRECFECCTECPDPDLPPFHVPVAMRVSA